MLPGLRAALNYHPMFVHFPIVLWLAALLFQVLALRRSSDEMQRVGTWMLYLGTLAAIVTVLTGLAAENSVPPGDAMRAVGIHETLMLVSTSLALALCIFAFLAEKFYDATAQTDAAGTGRSRSASDDWGRPWRAVGVRIRNRRELDHGAGTEIGCLRPILE